MSRRRNDFFGDDNNKGTSAFFNLTDDGKIAEENENISLFGESQNKSNSSSSVYQHKVVKQERDYNRPKPVKKRKIRRKPREKAKSGVVLLVVMAYAVVGFVVSSLMITRYSYICRVDDDLDTLQSEIDMLESEVEARRLEVSLKDDISLVQTRARKELNMYYPKNDQIVYIELEDLDILQSDDIIDDETIEVLSEPMGAKLE